MIVHLVDGTYELFRHFYGLRRSTNGKERRFGAVVGVLNTMLQMIGDGATHLGVATDHVIESFRNELWSGYKRGAGIDPALLAQFEPLEDALRAMGIPVWAMIELEADDALASAATIASQDSQVQKICIWTPDKDLSQCVREDRIVQMDRRSNVIRDADGVRAKFGVHPELIPDYLALVGDTAFEPTRNSLRTSTSWSGAGLLPDFPPCASSSTRPLSLRALRKPRQLAHANRLNRCKHIGTRERLRNLDNVLACHRGV